MAEIVCKDCGANFDSELVACPQCGCVVKRDNSRRWIIIALVSIICVAAIAAIMLRFADLEREAEEREALAVEMEQKKQEAERVEKMNKADQEEVNRVKKESEEKRNAELQAFLAKEVETARESERFQAEMNSRIAATTYNNSTQTSNVSYQNDMAIIDELENYLQSLSEFDNQIDLLLRQFREEAFTNGFDIRIGNTRTKLLDYIDRAKNKCKDGLSIASGIQNSEARAEIKNSLYKKIDAYNDLSNHVSTAGYPH